MSFFVLFLSWNRTDNGVVDGGFGELSACGGLQFAQVTDIGVLLGNRGLCEMLSPRGPRATQCEREVHAIPVRNPIRPLTGPSCCSHAHEHSFISMPIPDRRPTHGRSQVQGRVARTSA
jgi:hypothetical protein